MRPGRNRPRDPKPWGPRWTIGSEGSSSLFLARCGVAPGTFRRFGIPRFGLRFQMGTSPWGGAEHWSLRRRGEKPWPATPPSHPQEELRERKRSEEVLPG